MPINSARVEEMRQMLEDARTLLRNVLEEEFMRGAQDVFAAHPVVASFGWAQYTPYRSEDVDDDVREFSAHVDEPYVNGVARWDCDDLQPTMHVDTGRMQTIVYNSGTHTYQHSYQVPLLETQPNPAYRPDLVEAYRSVELHLAHFNDLDYKMMFGDHCQVEIIRDSLRPQVNAYDHD